jgi:hypothetical protein
MLGTLGLKILLIDEAATARTLKLQEPADRAQQRFGNVSRLSGSPALRAPKDSRSASGSGQRGLRARPVQGKKPEVEFCETIANIFRWPRTEAQAFGHQLQIVPKLVVTVLYLISDLAPLKRRE